MKYQNILIEGNIGVGKTTLYKKLVNFYKDENIKTFDFNEEIIDDNPYLLGMYYDQPEEWGDVLQSQIFLQRFHQLIQRSYNPKEGVAIFDRSFIGDRAFIDVMYPNGYLTQNFYFPFLILLSNLFKDIKEYLVGNTLVIYLYASPEKCLANIKKRDRINESDQIDPKYLENLENSYKKILQDVPFDVLDLSTKKDLCNQKGYAMLEKIIPYL